MYRRNRMVAQVGKVAGFGGLVALAMSVFAGPARADSGWTPYFSEEQPSGHDDGGQTPEIAAVAASGTDGRFRLPSLRPGYYVLTATAMGFSGGRSGRVHVVARTWVSNVEVPLLAGGDILSGHVLDAGDGPVATAFVRAIKLDAWPGPFFDCARRPPGGLSKFGGSICSRRRLPLSQLCY